MRKKVVVRSCHRHVADVEAQENVRLRRVPHGRVICLRFIRDLPIVRQSGEDGARFLLVEGGDTHPATGTKSYPTRGSSSIALIGPGMNSSHAAIRRELRSIGAGAGPYSNAFSGGYMALQVSRSAARERGRGRLLGYHPGS